MSKLLTHDDKLAKMETMYDSFTKAQVGHLNGITNIDARYTCAMRYMRELNEGKKGERKKAEEYYKRYGKILEGLDCIDNKLWTDEKKIIAFGEILEEYAKKCEHLIDENNRRRLESLKMLRDQHYMTLKAECEKYDKEIKELELMLGNNQTPNTVVTDVSLIP